MKAATLLALVAVVVISSAACSRQSPSPTPATPGEGETPMPAPQAALVVARVVRVIDGATIEVEAEGRTFAVRYLGVEVPLGVEQEALEINRFLLEGRTVQLERDAVDADPTGRLLRYVYVDGEMANRALLANGYAVVAPFPEGFILQTDFLLAQEGAKAALRGVWEPPSDRRRGEQETALSPTPAAIQEFSGGTLPKAPEAGTLSCDYSGTSQPVIKGNADARTGEHIYHVPGGLFYDTTVVAEAEGDRWLCTELEAIAQGWKRSKR